MRCISSVFYSFLINGEVRGSLKPSRGLRQGDHLSPYLFVICAHGLSELLIMSKKCKLLRDDSLIFCRAKLSECEKLRQCLVCYSKAFGQLINYEKSTLTFSPNAARSTIGDICSLFGISLVDGHNLYLGLPTFSARNKRMQFGYIRDMVAKKLQGWKEKNFSQGGKEVLLKSIIQAIPSYAMSCFIIPDSIIREIEAACARFW
ncbi:hypothetical protein UlMin_001286 [Ulmus minor]